MSRPVAGLACRIRVPVRQYEAVAVLVGEARHVIRLMHRDAGLSIDVEEFTTFETAEEFRDRLAGFLGLPPMTMAGAPAAAETTGAVAPQPRRRRLARGRRPRFLTRRWPGSGEPLGKIEGREIIARN
jgi:hypothetical protein